MAQVSIFKVLMIPGIFAICSQLCLMFILHFSFGLKVYRLYFLKAELWQRPGSWIWMFIGNNLQKYVS